jgi:acid stress-induced BolA-like protein IbaG/YrbA
MAATTKKQLERILNDRLRLKDPEFLFEKLPGGKFSGNLVSDTFVGLEHIDRQKRIWEALEAEFGEDSPNLVGTILAYTRAEWDVPLEGDPPRHVKPQRTK